MMKQDSALTVPTELFLALYIVQTSDQQTVCTVFICKNAHPFHKNAHSDGAIVKDLLIS